MKHCQTSLKNQSLATKKKFLNYLQQRLDKIEIENKDEAFLRERLLTMLKSSDGFLPVGDKTSPDEIYKLFSVSKKTFKKAVGILYKKKILSIDSDGIRLL